MKELLYNTALETGINLTDIQLEKFQIYYNLLIETNKVINLTSITEEKDVVLKHFIDSLAIKNYIDISNGRVIDIGTGAGFPGIPLAIIYNDTQFTLMDSLNKRINFINTVMEECKLYNIETVHSRAEDLGHNNVYREKYDYCVSRAVAAIPVLLEYCIPFLKTGGKFISYKSEKAEEEISLSGNAQKSLDADLINYIVLIYQEQIFQENLLFLKKLKLQIGLIQDKRESPREVLYRLMFFII